MRLGTWKVRRLYRAGSLMGAAAADRELARYKLDLAFVQEVMRDKHGRVTAGGYISFYGGEYLDLGWTS